MLRPAFDSFSRDTRGIIGHEYFHNWTGNRVTLRDWFQLSLKEGLTVFRDQEFTADLTSREVKRIAAVKLLRQCQFPEDAGAMAHPVRPEEYQKIDNFYSYTVYEKGAEVHNALLPNSEREREREREEEEEVSGAGGIGTRLSNLCGSVP